MTAVTAGPSPVLRGAGLRKAFGGQALFDALEIELHAGELVLLRGDNGAGKSTLIDILTGNQRADGGRLEVRAAGGASSLIDARRGDPTRLARLGVVKGWQRPDLFWTHTVADNLQIAASGGDDAAPRALLRLLGRWRGDGAAACDGAGYLATLGVAALAGQPATALSFGQGRRVSIALSAVAATRALLLDEPLASLDQAAARAVNRFLAQLVAAGERAVLVVEHALNERLLAGLDYRVLELRGGRLLRGNPGAASTAGPAAATAAGGLGIARWTATLERGNALRRQGQPEDLGDGAFLLRFRGAPAGGGAPLPAAASGRDRLPVLALERLRVKRGAWQLFTPERGQADGVSLAIGRGEVAVLLARNGWGKSSLARVIAGELPAAGGRVLLEGREVSRLAAWKRRRCGLIYAETASLLFSQLAVDETLRLKGMAGWPSAGGGGFLPAGGRLVRTLSGGERQNLALHCALGAPHGSLLVLDEPFNGLDASAVAHWLGLFTAAALQGKALLICLPA
jgi:branched-chain amino acid transport system ATP-binding protein